MEVIMKAVILDGSRVNDATGERVRRTLMTELQANGWNVENVTIRDQKIGNCAGDFFCWVRSPGICHVDDDNRRIAEAIIASDITVYLTPVTFGGYSSMLKRMVDHTIQNIAPYFTKVEGETHHKKRYGKYPDLLVIGWMEAPDTQAEAVFRHLVKRNTINFYAEKAACGVVTCGQSDDEIATSVKAWLNDIQSGHPLPAVKLPESDIVPVSVSEIKRALLLIGSPKTRKSNSNSLGGYLFDRLGSHSIQTETVYLHTTVRSPDKMKVLLESIDGADLVALAFPLYEDTLPSPVIDVLEQIATHRKSGEQNHRPLFTAIVNCGFPEAHHNANALAICATFAKQARLQWVGGLSLGGGEQIGGRPLMEVGGQTIGIRKALDQAAEALVKGQTIPKTTQELISKPVIPAWAYRLLGEYIWKKRAKPYGAGKLLKMQPYLVKTKRSK
jgi:multimeric flavodoxin WrbA